jgi:hypothetical protein
VILYDWYRGFIQFLIDNHTEVFMGKVVAFGETAVGIGLILGAFVGVAALAGGFMNMNFMLAGSASSNPVLLIGHPARPRLEDRRVHRTGPLPAPDPRHPLEGTEATDRRRHDGPTAAARLGRSFVGSSFLRDLRLDPLAVRAAVVLGDLLLEPRNRLVRRLCRWLSELVTWSHRLPLAHYGFGSPRLPV